MRVIKSIAQIRSALSRHRSSGRSIGFVPTMGALHEGHLSLIRLCRRENDVVVLSIFVNPKQFAKGEDFTRYPRQKINDETLAEKGNVDIIFYPSTEMMYPRGYLTYIDVKLISAELCGKSRPGHFQGVTTVVGKLINIVQPTSMYLGQKDAQQVVVIKKMVADLNLPVKICVGPTIRESDGLALSSRNIFLNKAQRREASEIYKALLAAKRMAQAVTVNPNTLRNHIRQHLKKYTSATVDYIECVNADSLENLKTLKGKILLAVAAKFGKTRLIDNISFRLS